MYEFQRNLAIVIGIDQYQNGIHPLQTAVADTWRLAHIFQNNYQYTLLNPFSKKETAITDQDATLANLRSLLTDILPKQIKPTKSDRLLFYFAGHGIAQNSETGPQGYIVPQDANLNNPQSLLPMQELHDSLASLDCRHLLIILDCCFAGTFRWASTRKLIPIPQKIHQEHYDRFINYPAWQVITSASHNQEALDFLNQDNRGVGASGKHSPFAEGLFTALEEQKADLIQDGVITAPELYLYLRDYVEKNTQQMQTPGLWTLKKHDRGEFIFKLPNVEPDLEPAPELNPANNPYRGLKAYDEQHARLFFGRQELIQKLFRQVSNPQQQFTVVLGISGSGKSSLVKAGLLPQLRQEQVNLLEACILSLAILEVLPYFPLQYLPIACTYQWQILTTMRPASNPWQELANAFSGLSKDNLSQPQPNVPYNSPLLKGGLREDHPSQDAFKADTIINSINEWSNNNPRKKLLLVIDQFEELITQAPKPIPQSEEQKEQTWLEQLKNLLSKNKQKEDLFPAEETKPQWKQFLDVLVNILQNCPQLSIVVTLRSDFEPRFAETILKPYWNRFIVRPMYANELREVIETPATEMALYFEPANLVDRLVDEVNQMPGALPLLSFTLSELYIKLYEEWKGGIKSDRSLTVDEEFTQQGGVAGSLTRRANEEYNHLPDDAHKTMMRRVMLRMMEIEGGEAVRRRVLKSELTYPSAEENQRVEKVLDCLIQARLIVTGKDIVTGESYYEPAHDFLVKGWDKLQIWIQAEQESLALQRLLIPATQAWQKNQLTSDLWNTNSRLDRLKEIKQSPKSWLNRLETNFISASVRRKQFIRRVRWSIAGAVFLSLSTLTIYALIGQRNAIIRQAIASEQSAQVNLRLNHSLDGMVDILQAGNSLGHPLVSNPFLQWFKSTKTTEKAIANTLQWAIYQVRENNRMKGHNSIARSAISPNNQYIVTGGEDGIINLRNLEGKLLQSWQGDEKRVWDVTFSPDSQLIVSAGEDGIVRLWNLTGEQLQTLQGHQGSVRYLDFSPDGKAIVSTGGEDGMIYFWDLSGNAIASWQADEQFFAKTIDFHPDKSWIATTGREPLIKIWDLQGNLITTLNFHAWGAYFSDDGKYLVAAGDDGTIGLWDSEFKLLKKWRADQQRIWNVAFRPDSQQITSGGEDGVVRIWNLQGQLLEKFQGHTGPVRSVYYTADSRQLISSGDDGTTRMWNEQNRQLHSFTTTINSLKQVSFTADDQSLVLLASNGNANLLNLSKQNLTQLLPTNQAVNGLSFASHSGILVQASQDNQLTLFYLAKRQQLLTLSTVKQNIDRIFLSPQGNFVATTQANGTIRVRSTKNGKQLAVFRNHNGLVNDLDFSNNEQLLASSGEDGKVNLWQIKTKKLLNTFQDHIGQVDRVDFSNDGKQIVSAGDDKTIRVWDVNLGSAIAIFQIYKHDVTAVQFSPDRQAVISSDSGGRIQLWNIEQQEETANWLAHQTPIQDLDLSSDGKLLATLGSQGDIKLWQLESFEQLIVMGCQSINHFLENQPNSLVFNNSFCSKNTAKNDILISNNNDLKISFDRQILTEKSQPSITRDSSKLDNVEYTNYWLGSWQHSFIGDSENTFTGKMNFSLNQGQVEGDFTIPDRNLTGKISDVKLKEKGMIIEGKWSNNQQNRGKFIFKLNPNFDRFSGHYSIGKGEIKENKVNQWNGIKTIPNQTP